MFWTPLSYSGCWGSVGDGYRLSGTDIRRFFDIMAKRLVSGLCVLQDSLLVEAENGRRRERALPVVVALCAVDMYLHCFLLVGI
jgi:hypothetical protein